MDREVICIFLTNVFMGLVCHFDDIWDVSKEYICNKFFNTVLQKIFYKIIMLNI